MPSTPTAFTSTQPSLLLRVSISRLPSISQFKWSRVLLWYARCALSWSGTVKPFLSLWRRSMSVCPDRSTALCSLTRGESREVNPLHLREMWTPESCRDLHASSDRCGDMLLAWKSGVLCRSGKSVGGKVPLREFPTWVLQWKYNNLIVAVFQLCLWDLKGKCRFLGNQGPGW